jgi:hypothetical protein
MKKMMLCLLVVALLGVADGVAEAKNRCRPEKCRTQKTSCQKSQCSKCPQTQGTACAPACTPCCPASAPTDGTAKPETLSPSAADKADK